MTLVSNYIDPCDSLAFPFLAGLWFAYDSPTIQHIITINLIIAAILQAAALPAAQISEKKADLVAQEIEEVRPDCHASVFFFGSNRNGMYVPTQCHHCRVTALHQLVTMNGLHVSGPGHCSLLHRFPVYHSHTIHASILTYAKHFLTIL